MFEVNSNAVTELLNKLDAIGNQYSAELQILLGALSPSSEPKVEMRRLATLKLWRLRIENLEALIGTYVEMSGLDITRHKALESYLVTLMAWLAAGKPDLDDLSPLPRS